MSVCFLLQIRNLDIVAQLLKHLDEYLVDDAVLLVYEPADVRSGSPYHLGKHLALCFEDPADIDRQIPFRLLFQQTKQVDPRVKIRRVVPGDGEQIPVGKVPALVCDFFLDFRTEEATGFASAENRSYPLQITSC